MAKRSNESVSGTDKAKVRVFFAELEGNNESVQEALKTMVSAMSRPVRIISDQRGNENVPTLLDQADLGAVEEPLEALLDDEVSSEDTLPQGGRKPRGSGRKTDRNAGLELVPNLEFRPDGQPPLKEFYKQKSPGNDLTTVLVFVYYLQNVMRLPKIGPNHIMTAFKECAKPIPVDLRQTIRNIKKSKMWINFSDIEDIKITTQGENHVEHEMGAGE